MSVNVLVKQSIFKQEIYLRVYDTKLIMRRVGGLYTERYEFDKTSKLDLINTETISTIKLPMPLLNVGDRFYIEECDVIVKIQEVIRTSKDCVLYLVEPRIIDDEESLYYMEKFLEDKKHERFVKQDVIDTILRKVRDYNKLSGLKRMFNKINLTEETK